MARSFGCNVDTANEIVQEMYLRLMKYVDTPERIMRGDEINTYYVYVTLRNIYLTEIQNSKKVVKFNNDISIENEEVNLTKKLAFDKIIDRIEEEVSNWYWYDKKLWEIHFERPMSMRSISKVTTISLSSIFNTLKKSKNKIREAFGEDVEDYKNGDYDRI